MFCLSFFPVVLHRKPVGTQLIWGEINGFNLKFISSYIFNIILKLERKAKFNY